MLPFGWKGNVRNGVGLTADEALAVPPAATPRSERVIASTAKAVMAEERRIKELLKYMT
jgi:hypothetical protein